MIQSFIDSLTILTSNDSGVQFQRDCIRGNSCDCWLCHNQGSANYNIVKEGIYEIDFNATVSSATAGVVAFQLFNNGEQIPGTLMAETLAAAGNYANIGINKKIRVCCRANANISVRSVPLVADATDITAPAIETQTPIIANANFSISRKA